MGFYGGVPTEAQMDGYLANKAGASTNQKTLVTNARAGQGSPSHHHLSVMKIKEILTNNS